MTDRIASVAVVLGLVLLSVLAPPAIAGHQGADAPAQTTATPQDPAPPGERFQGAVGIHVAEVEGEMEARRFDVGFENSDSDASKAALVAEQTAELDSRLSELHQQRRSIQQARENGSISRGEYRARVAALSARTRTVERLANRTGQAARSLPEEALNEHGVEVAAIRELSANASELSGGEVAAIARSMAGDTAGRPLDASNRPSLPGPAPDERQESRPRDGTETQSPTPRSDEPTPTDDAAADAKREEEEEDEQAEEEETEQEESTTTDETATSTPTPTATPAEENSTEKTPTSTPEDEDTPREATATSTPTPDEETAAEATATSTTTPNEETAVENRRSLRERIEGWLGSPEYQPVGVARGQSTELRERPLLDVPLREDGSGRVTLVLVFDLTGDSARRAFETMREDEAARADVRDRFRSRMASIAEQSAAVTDRSMRVHDARLNLNRSEDGETGVVRVSVAWEGLAALEDDHLVVTEPFASGFTPDREFRVRITAPEQYSVTTTRPEPVEQDAASVAWAKGTELDGFTLVFSPESRTSIPTERIEDLQPERTISPGATDAGAPGFGAPVAILALLAIVLAVRRKR